MDPQITNYAYICIRLLQASIHGLTGRIDFVDGRRNNFKIDLLKLKREQIEKVGYWSPQTGINITDPTAFYETSSTNITLIVMTREVCSSFVAVMQPSTPEIHTHFISSTTLC